MNAKHPGAVRPHLRWAQLLQAPHRLAFFLAGVNLLLSATWWAWWCGFGGGQPSLVLPPGWLHGQLMVCGFIPLYFAGFLFTAGPRWLQMPEVKARDVRPACLMLATGWWLVLLGAVTNSRIVALGQGLSLLGWSLLMLRFAMLTWRSRVDDRLHAKLVVASGLLGALAMAASVLGLLLGRWDLWRSATWLALWGWVVPVFVVVLHRMIPFFTAAALPRLDAWRPNWLLWTLLTGTWLQGALHLAEGTVLQRSELPWLHTALPLPWGLLVLGLAMRWGLVQSLRIRLLAMLHLGFVWMGLAFLLELHPDPLLSVHALGIGCLGSLLLAMVTRVSCGHGGRTLVADDFIWAAFLGLQGVAVLRLAALLWPASSGWLVPAAALGWWLVMGAWSLRLLRWYLRPRVDGRPG
jgi:uncharacterized protein involved in response to NO